MIVINGGKIAEIIYVRLRQMVVPRTALAVLWVGSDPASAVFIRRKEHVAWTLGSAFQLHRFADTTTFDEVYDRICALSRDATVGGIVLQLPVPKRFDRDALIAAITIHKDVDNVTGRARIEAPSVGAVREILQSVKCNVQNFGIIAVIGRGFLVGEPILNWLYREIKNQQLKIKIKVADITTKNFQQFVSDADLVITGVGKPGLIDLAWLKDGAGIIDFGFPPDVAVVKLKTKNLKLAFYTPTPGGTGPIVVAKLFENFYALHKERG